MYLLDHSPSVTKSPFGTDTPPSSFTNVQKDDPLGTPFTSLPSCPYRGEVYLLDRPIERWQSHYSARPYLLDHSPNTTKSPFGTDIPPSSFTNVQKDDPLGTPFTSLPSCPYRGEVYLLDRPIKRWQSHYLARLYLLDHLSIERIWPGTTGIHVVSTPTHPPGARSTCYRMIGGHHATINLSKVSRDKSNANLSRYKAKVWLMLHRAQQCQVGLKNTQLCMAPGISCCRSVHSKV